MMITLRNRIAKNYINAFGWRTKNKYLLIESDDWGAVRLPSRDTYSLLKSNNINIDDVFIDKYDSVESEEDFVCLFDVLSKFKDSRGKSPILTAYHVMGNPNFEAIENNGKVEYVFESILETYSRNESTINSFRMIQKGIQNGLYFPQFHGREHIHVGRWMKAINSSSKKEQIAFQNRAIIWAGSSNCNNPFNIDYFKGFDFDSDIEIQEVNKIHTEGLKLFNEIFGMKSLTFTAQGSVWGDQLLPVLKENGVKLIGGFQIHPYPTDSKYKVVNKFWGRKNSLNQLYWRRNCLFEPFRNPNLNVVNKCLEDIEVAFRWGKPAVISSHRVNFIGSIFPENRNNSLKQLDLLLKRVLEKWPDVQFIHSAQLAELMLNSNK